MSWYGDDLIANSKWVLDKAKIALTTLGSAAAAAKQAATTAAATAAAAAATAATAEAAAAAAAGTALAAEALAAAEAAAAAAATAASVAASAAAAATLAAEAAACAAAALAGMGIGQGIGWVGDKLVEGIGGLFSYAGPPPPIGDGFAAAHATDQAIALMCMAEGVDFDPAAFDDSCHDGSVATIAYAFARSNTQLLMHLGQSIAYAEQGDGPRSGQMRAVILDDLKSLASLQETLADALQARPSIFAGLTLSPADYRGFVEKAKKVGEAALPSWEGPALRAVFHNCGLVLAPDAECQIARWVAASETLPRAFDAASGAPVALVDWLDRSAALWRDLQDIPLDPKPGAKPA